jgi:predicted lipoprotein with Yx(FWY)xxD motif
MHRRFALSSVAVIALIVLAACGSDSTSTATSAGAAADTTTASGGSTAGAASVQTATSGLGTILVDSAGATVYMFQKDTPTSSACSGACADKWPSVTGAATVGEGLDASLLTTITGANGEQQLAYNGHPLYHFAGDSKPGDTNGQKVGDVWFVLDATGSPITT